MNIKKESKDYDSEAHKELVAMQPGDVPVTYADTLALERDFGFKPSTSLRDGLRKVAEWYKEFYTVPSECTYPLKSFKKVAAWSPFLDG